MPVTLSVPISPWYMGTKDRNTAKVASQAGLWYNGRNNVRQHGVSRTMLTVIHLSLKRRCIVDTIPPRDENGKLAPFPPGPTAISGIYQITNTITGDFYIGSSANIKERWRDHVRKLRRGNYACVILQRAWSKYGEEAFTFSIVEPVEREKVTLLARETYYIQTLRPAYNATLRAESHLGMKRSEETKAKLRQRVMSEETKEKLRQAHLDKKMPEEQKRKISQTEKMRYANLPIEAKQAHREARIGQKLIPEQKERQMAVMQTLEYRERQRQSHLNFHPIFTPEHCANISKAKKGRSTSSPEHMAKMSAARWRKKEKTDG
jgi:group I intron endonuclease